MGTGMISDELKTSELIIPHKIFCLFFTLTIRLKVSIFIKDHPL